jgi:hypothetical protein
MLKAPSGSTYAPLNTRVSIIPSAASVSKYFR